MHNKHTGSALLAPPPPAASEEYLSSPASLPTTEGLQTPKKVSRLKFPRKIPRRILGFSLVGGSVMLGGIILLFILVQFLHVEKHLAYLIQAIVSIETNFLLNRLLNWKDRHGNFFVQWIKFHSTSALTFPLNQGLFALLSWLGLPYLLITLIGAGLAAIVNYLANDHFVFHQKKARAVAAPAWQRARITQLGTTLPHVGVVVPVRNAQRTIRQCLSALLVQEYAGQVSIFLVGNVPEQDTTWTALEEFLDDPRIHIVQIRRPALWTGRDANMKRYYGSETALAAGVDVIAFTDSQVIAPDTWLASAVTQLLEQGVDGVAGKSCRRLDHTSLSAIYQEASLFSEWPRYGNGFRLLQKNFYKAKGLPITNNLLLTREAWVRVRANFPLKTTYSWEDFRLAWELACAGCVLYCTDMVCVYRNHQSRFRLAKHIAAGAGALTFYREQPDCSYVKRMIWKAYSVTMSACVFGILLCVALFSSNILLLLILGCLGCLSLLILGIFSTIKAHDIRGMLFPVLDIVHISLWIFGVFTIDWKEEENETDLADLLVQLR